MRKKTLTNFGGVFFTANLEERHKSSIISTFTGNLAFTLKKGRPFLLATVPKNIDDAFRHHYFEICSAHSVNNKDPTAYETAVANNASLSEVQCCHRVNVEETNADFDEGIA